MQYLTFYLSLTVSIVYIKHYFSPVATTIYLLYFIEGNPYTFKNKDMLK